jgi:hypothetical protein
MNRFANKTKIQGVEAESGEKCCYIDEYRQKEKEKKIKEIMISQRHSFISFDIPSLSFSLPHLSARLFLSLL